MLAIECRNVLFWWIVLNVIPICVEIMPQTIKGKSHMERDSHVFEK